MDTITKYYANVEREIKRICQCVCDFNKSRSCLNLAEFSFKYSIKLIDSIESIQNSEFTVIKFASIKDSFTQVSLDNITRLIAFL